MTLGHGKIRLDHALVLNGLARSRSQARDLIKRSCVTVDGSIADKAGREVSPTARICVAAGGQPYASRAGLKLAAALDAFAFDPTDRVALDIGASTGGFADVLLQRGANRVFAVDVGTGQLDERLRGDPRIVNLEGTDARTLSRSKITEPVSAIVADVSFISLTKVLAVPLRFAGPATWLVVLIKPQFEVGRSHLGKGGIVKDAAARESAIDAISAFVRSQPGWHVAGIIPSPVQGGSGNLEFLLGATYDG